MALWFPCLLCTQSGLFVSLGLTRTDLWLAFVLYSLFLASHPMSER